MSRKVALITGVTGQDDLSNTLFRYFQYRHCLRVCPWPGRHSAVAVQSSLPASFNQPLGELGLGRYPQGLAQDRQ